MYSRRGKKGKEFGQCSLHSVALNAEIANFLSIASTSGGIFGCHLHKGDFKNSKSHVVTIDRWASRVADEIRNNRFGIKPLGPFGSVLSLYPAAGNDGFHYHHVGEHELLLCLGKWNVFSDAINRKKISRIRFWTRTEETGLSVCSCSASRSGRSSDRTCENVYL